MEANLADADLEGAKLVRANLRGAKLTGVNLAGVNLREARLARADLRNATLADTLTSGSLFAEEKIGRALNVTQTQIDTAWASADEPPLGLDRLDPPLSLPKNRWRDPKLRDGWFGVQPKACLYGNQRPPDGCFGATHDVGVSVQTLLLSRKGMPGSRRHGWQIGRGV